MNNIAQMLLALDDLCYALLQDEYEQERTKVASQIALFLPGFTIAYAVELGTVGAGENIYLHGGVGHVLLPCA